MPAGHHARWTPVVVGGSGSVDPPTGPPPHPPAGPTAGTGDGSDLPIIEHDLPDTAGAVAHRALESAVVQYLEHESDLVTATDIETIHQARVATRRLRSHLRTFRPLFLHAWADDLRAHLDVVARALGTVRDADVLHERLAGRVGELEAVDDPAAAVLLERADAQRSVARASLAGLLATPQYASIHDAVLGAVAAPLYSRRARRPAHREITALVRRPWKQLRDRVEALGDDPRDEALHETRIAVKRCRYAAQAAVPLLGREARDFADALRRMQNRLGEHRDAVTMHAWLRGSAGLVDAPVAFVAGELAAVERVAIDDARARWRPAFKRVRRARLR